MGSAIYDITGPTRTKNYGTQPSHHLPNSVYKGVTTEASKRKVQSLTIKLIFIVQGLSAAKQLRTNTTKYFQENFHAWCISEIINMIKLKFKILFVLFHLK